MRRIDHLVVAVRDLDAAGDLYRRLGFTVGARNRHPWGTENRIIQFHSSFIELITVGTDASAIPPHQDGVFSFGAFVRDALARREGMAMLVLDSADAQQDARAFAAAGIGAFAPFFFERSGQRPDGSPVHVAFTLAFAVDPLAPQAGFFVCQQHYPENFWNPAFQHHPNGGEDIATVTLSAPDPQAHATFLAAFSGSSTAGTGTTLSCPLDGGQITVVPGVPACFTAYSVRVASLADQALRLDAAGFPYTRDDTGLHLAPDTLYGVGLHFSDTPALPS